MESFQTEAPLHTTAFFFYNSAGRSPSNAWPVMAVWCIGTCLTHWGWVTHICAGKLITIGSDNGLAPDRRHAIIWTNAGLLSIGPLRTYFSENLIKMQQFSLSKEMHVEMSTKWHPSCLGLNVLTMDQVTACCLTAPIHHLNQKRLITEVLWNSDNVHDRDMQNHVFLVRKSRDYIYEKW